ncbi:MAG TPA: N-acetyltransferase [Caulobacteraceae bacterium]|jgi:predicted N-acetyltransferase YhbS|nr:N-acetyltransferase [Caulobacteraceae bacterium]
MIQQSAAQAGVLPPLILEQAHDTAAVDALIDHAFGPGRYVKAAERLREHNRPLLDISHVAFCGGELVGCVRMWPIRIGEPPAVLLGPFAVAPDWRSRGLGAALIERACKAAKAAGHGLVLLVGDAPYFEPLGFQVVPPGRVVMPGPVDPARVMYMSFGGEACPAGAVSADPNADLGAAGAP